MPRVFISYSHDTPAHKDRVLALSDRLRQQGVDCYIDQYEQSPAEGWPLWCEKEIDHADFVLVTCTETYLRRFRKEEQSEKKSNPTLAEERFGKVIASRKTFTTPRV